MRLRLGRAWSAAAMLAAGSALLAAGALATGQQQTVRNGGTFRIVTAGIDNIDPALSFFGQSELGAACLTLPEAAQPPKVSKNGLTYTYTIRKGQRFNTGERVTAASFAHELTRVLSPDEQSAAAQYYEAIDGAQEFENGKAKDVSGLTVRGRTLVIRLAQPTPDLPARLRMTFACAVPVELPTDPGGVPAPLPSAGPYFVARYVPGRLMVVKRNPLYRGSRPHHVNEFRVSFVDTAATGIARVARGQADWVDEGASSEYAGIRKKFKILKRQLFQVSGLSTRFVEMNNSRGLFRNNVKLRRAVNFAIDRPALVRARELVGTLTDQYLPPAIPGFRDARIYPLRRPDVRRAKGLARGHTRGGVAVLYAQDNPPNVAQAQVLTKDLARIGIHVETKTFPGPQLFARLFTPGEPWDLTLVGYGPDYPDPYAMLNTLFDGAILRANPEKSFNIARFDSPKYNRLLQRASRLAGRARVRAYGNLDVELARDAAPLAAYASETAFFFFSRRTGCVRFDPLFDLAAVCLRG